MKLGGQVLKLVEKKYASVESTKIPDFRPGDVVSVHVRILEEGQKSRLQVYQGTVIGMKRAGDLNGHFRVRKISSGIGVERVFPFHAPCVAKVEVITKAKSRRAKHYFLRERTGKGARAQIDYDRN